MTAPALRPAHPTGRRGRSRYAVRAAGPPSAAVRLPGGRVRRGAMAGPRDNSRTTCHPLARMRPAAIPPDQGQVRESPGEALLCSPVAVSISSAQSRSGSSNDRASGGARALARRGAQLWRGAFDTHGHLRCRAAGRILGQRSGRAGVGVALLVRRACHLPEVQVVCFATNSRRRPQAVPGSAGVRVVYLASAGKPMRQLGRLVRPVAFSRPGRSPR